MKTSLAAALLLFAAVPAAAQSSSMVRLRVVNDADGQPLRRARAIVAADTTTSPAFTGEDGVMTITARAGARIRISKAGFAPALVTAPAKPAPLDIRLTPAAVITGRVVDILGEAAVRISVTIRRLDPVAAPDPAVVMLRTDDRGEFRVGNLTPGRYEVALASYAVTVSTKAGEHADVPLESPTPSVEFPFADGGVISGAIVDEYGEPVAGARVSLIALGPSGSGDLAPPVSTDDLGRYRIFQVPPERYVLVVTSADSPPAPGTVAAVRGSAPLPHEAFLPAYYPGRVDPTEAIPITVERGIENPGMDMVMPRVRGVRVFGTVTMAPGMPAPRMVLRPVAGGIAETLGQRRVLAEGGRFDLTNVPPGHYALQALAPVAYDRWNEPTDFGFVSSRILVGAEDVGPMALSLAPTSTIRGRIVLEGMREGARPDLFRLAPLPVEPADSPDPRTVAGVMSTTGEIAPAADWTFRISGLAGLTRIALAMAPEGWWLKSVRIGSVNAALQPASFGSPEDSRHDVEVVLADSGAMIGGRAADDKGQPAGLYTVIAFARDRHLWFTGSPLVKTTTSRSDGSFILPSLPPGDYHLAAVEFSEIDPNAQERIRPESLARLAAIARQVSVVENERLRADLTLVP